MKRAVRLSLVGMVYLMMMLGSASSWGQGVLIVVDPPGPTPLPRPIIWPPRPQPIPRPRPVPEPPATYKIKELGVQARLVDQVARVQVSQTFENTGSRQMEVSFVFPLPYDGAIDRDDASGRRQGVPGQAVARRERGPAHVRESIVRRTRIRPCWNGWARACSRPASSRFRPGPSAP
jgi:Ca-activated chloride channel homolog